MAHRTPTVAFRASSASRGSSVEIVETTATSPATSAGLDKQEGKREGEGETEQAKEEGKPVKKPAVIYQAIKDMLKKTQIYLDQIEGAAAGGDEQPEESDDEVEIVETSPSSKRKRAAPKDKARKKQKKEQKKKAERPPMNFPQDPLVTGGTLKDYQLNGVNWMITRYLYALSGAILADEMGTGKTLQTISFLAFIHSNIRKADDPKTDKPSIVILPKPVLQNWAAELERFAPGIPVLAYQGTKQERAKMRKDRLGFRGTIENDKLVRTRRKMPVILVGYTTLLNDHKFLNQLKYDLIVCDEAHKAKNLKGRTMESLQSLKGDFRLLLTGTPLQNNLSELYSLLFFILPHIFVNRELFLNQFDFSSITTEDGAKLSAEEEVQLLVVQLQALLKPFMLRRCKKDVIKEMPLKKEYVLTAPQTARQKELLEAAIKGELRAFLTNKSQSATASASASAAASPAPVTALDTIDLTSDGESGPSTPRRRPTRSAAKKAGEAFVQHEDSKDDDEFEEQMLERAEKEARQEEAAKLAKAAAAVKSSQAKLARQGGFNSAMMNLRQIACHPWLKSTAPAEITEDIVIESGKLMLLDRLLPELFKRGHKVIIFSQFVKMLDLLDDYFELRGWDWYRIDGRDNPVDQKDITEFNESPCHPDGVNIFTLSTRAGGVGINLVGADTVIIFDSDWNPQNDLQAMDRAHRIGQKNPVLVFRLATANTVEQHILASATRKRKLERVVLGNDTLSGGSAGDILNKARGGGGGKKQGSVAKQQEDTMKQLAEQLASTEGEKVTLAGAGAEILSDEQLEALLDRSDAAMKAVSGSDGEKGTTKAAFEVVETIEEEEVQGRNEIADLLERAQQDNDEKEKGGVPSATTTDTEDE
ncbi:hypothetical protein JCM8547_000531 [Rhodosporidiobolus lusitaniae]